MLPCQRGGQPRSASGAGIGIDCDRDTVIYDIVDADADSNGPGSTWGRTQIVIYSETYFTPPTATAGRGPGLLRIRMIWYCLRESVSSSTFVLSRQHLEWSVLVS